MWEKNTHERRQLETLERQSVARWYRWLGLSVWLLKHKQKEKKLENHQFYRIYNVSIDLIQHKCIVLSGMGVKEAHRQATVSF